MSELPVRNEEDRLDARALLLILAGVIAATLLCVGVAWFALDLREDAYRPGRAFPERDIRGKDVISGVEQTLIELRDHGGELAAEKRARLGSYGWVDEPRRVVRIPIERAIEITAGEAK